MVQDCVLTTIKTKGFIQPPFFAIQRQFHYANGVNMVNPSFYWGRIGTPRIVIGMLHKIPHQKWFTNQFSTRVSSSQVTHAEKSISSVRSGLDGANLRIAKQYVSRAPDRGAGKKQSVSSTVKRYGCVFFEGDFFTREKTGQPSILGVPEKQTFQTVQMLALRRCVNIGA